jgi:Protein of unknown function (DUF2806)
VITRIHDEQRMEASVGEIKVFDVSKFGEAAKILVEKLAGAGWLMYEPLHIKRLAAAEVAADRIRALGKVETSIVAERALVRLAYEETRKQQNVEEIAAGAFPLLEADAKAGELDEDWLALLFDRASLISDKDMQALWSRILAGEVNSPGTFSRRTLQVVSALEKKDADLIGTLCRLVWRFESDMVVIVANPQADIYQNLGLNFSSLTHLQSLGILTFDNPAGFILSDLPPKFVGFYFDTRFAVELSHTSPSTLPIGKAMLTSVGRELTRISSALPLEGFPEYCIGNLWALYRISFARL